LVCSCARDSGSVP